MRAEILTLVMASLLVVQTARAQTTPYPVVLTMTGPDTAVAGEDITYRVQYEITDGRGSAIVITVTPGASYLSSRVLSGPGGSLEHESERRAWWGVLAAEGEIEFQVRVDGNFTGSIFADAYVPGTETTHSNAVETKIVAPGMLPAAGGGNPVTMPGALAAAGALAFLGLALVSAGAAARNARKAS